MNIFPSFHAAVAAILWRLRPASRFRSAAVSAWTVALCGACILTRQHYVLDVVGGLAVGGFAVAAVDATTGGLGRARTLAFPIPEESKTAS